MPRPQYPTGDDLASYLLQAGFSETFLAAYDLELFALAGWEAFNRAANRTMLAVTGTRSFDAGGSNGVLVLGEDLASGVTPTATGYSTPLTVGTDVRFEPMSAAGRGKPYDRARFLWRRGYTAFPYSVAPQITITGSWGYAVEIPDDAFVGMLAMGALGMAPLLIQARTGGIQMWREADMEESYGPKPLQSLMEGWQGRAWATCGGMGPDGKWIMGMYTRVPFVMG